MLPTTSLMFTCSMRERSGVVTDGAKILHRNRNGFACNLGSPGLFSLLGNRAGWCRISGKTALIEAAQHGHTLVVDVLIAAGANVNTAGYSG